MMDRSARRKVKPTAQEREMAASVRRNGGTLTAEEIAHGRVYEYVGGGFNHRSKPEPGTWLANIIKGGGYVAKDGSVYRKR